MSVPQSQYIHMACMLNPLVACLMHSKHYLASYFSDSWRIKALRLNHIHPENKQTTKNPALHYRVQHQRGSATPGVKAIS